MKVMNKKVLLLFSVVGLVSCAYPKIDVQIEDTITDYTQLSASELASKVEAKDDFFIVSSLSTCTWCIQLKPIITEFVSEHHIPIYVITIYTVTEEGHEQTSFEDYQLINSLLPSETYPTLYVVDDGEIVNSGGVGGYSLDKFTDTILRYLD